MDSMTGSAPEHSEPGPPARFTRRRFLFGSAAAGAVGLAAYSSIIARHEVSILTHTIPIRELPPAFEDFRVAQISDIHLDEYTEPSFIRRIIQHVNDLQPDLVLITGDFVSFGPLPISFSRRAVYRCADLLKEIACPLRYGSIGNHDVSVGMRLVSQTITAAGIPVLMNEHVPIERHRQRLWLAGVLDPSSGKADLDPTIPDRPDGPVLLMGHSPDYADVVASHPKAHLVDFMFSGHSHGGQVRLPVLGPIILPPWGQKYPEGFYGFPNMTLYVNRGIGTTGVPFRLNCPPEITLFQLQNAANAAT
jgi:predicted MPP superfamily phosphohydrolase